MTEEEVLALMRSSKTEDEWEANVFKVKAAHDGHLPPWWFPKVIASGLLRETLGEGSDQITLDN